MTAGRGRAERGVRDQQTGARQRPGSGPVNRAAAQGPAPLPATCRPAGGAGFSCRVPTATREEARREAQRATPCVAAPAGSRRLRHGLRGLGRRRGSGAVRAGRRGPRRRGAMLAVLGMAAGLGAFADGRLIDRGDPRRRLAAAHAPPPQGRSWRRPHRMRQARSASTPTPCPGSRFRPSGHWAPPRALAWTAARCCRPIPPRGRSRGPAQEGPACRSPRSPSRPTSSACTASARRSGDCSIASARAGASLSAR